MSSRVAGPGVSGTKGNSHLKVYEGFGHGMCTTHHDVINADLPAFFKD
jgi:hypothetical protein